MLKKQLAQLDSARADGTRFHTKLQDRHPIAFGGPVRVRPLLKEYEHDGRLPRHDRCSEEALSAAVHDVHIAEREDARQVAFSNRIEGPIYIERSVKSAHQDILNTTWVVDRSINVD
jgi:hypothetical protein